MAKVFRFLGMVTGISLLMTMLRTSWDSFDSYGTVPAGQRSIVELPAGPISFAFESGSTSSKGVKKDLPTIVDMNGRELPVKFMEVFQGPSSSKTGMFSATVMRKRFATAEVPTDGDYAVTAGACPLLIGTAGFSRKPRPIATPALSS